MTRSPASTRPLTIALAGLAALAVAMGIGRFAFTPLLPLMMAEGSVSLPAASLLASANYFGYMLGAALLTLQPWLWRRLGWPAALNAPALIRAGLVATALLTAGMAWHQPAAWPWWRFAAGLASAVVFLFTSGWCLEQLARRNEAAMGALIYVGPGLGIVASGLAASVLAAWHAPAALGWLTFAVIAALLTMFVWPVIDRRHAIAAAPLAPAASTGAPAAIPASAVEMALLTVAYSMAGMGYIITATFLPVIARLALPGSRALDLFWPLFGVGVVIGAIGASRLRGPGDARLRLAACYAIQAVGVAATLLRPTLAGFAIGSLLLGMPFTAITYFAMQEARRLRAQPAGFMGLLTVMWGLGQMIGPPMAALLVAHSATAAAGFARSLWIATGALVFGMLLYLLLSRLYPARD